MENNNGQKAQNESFSFNDKNHNIAGTFFEIANHNLYRTVKYILVRANITQCSGISDENYDKHLGDLAKSRELTDTQL